MSAKKDILQELLESFHEELGDRLAAINTGLLTLEQQPGSAQRNEIFEEIFRNVHSLKGGARAAALQPIEELIHGLEDVFGAAKRGTIQMTPELFDLLYQGLDLVTAVMSSLEATHAVDPALDLPGYLLQLATAWRGQPITVPVPSSAPAPVLASTGAPAAPESAPAAEREAGRGGAGVRAADETIRVPTARLDDLMAQTGELLVTRLRAFQQVEDVKKVYVFATRRLQEWQQMREDLAAVLQGANGRGPRVRTFFDDTEEQLRTLATWLGDLARRFSDDATRLSQVTDKLQDGVKQTRMLPLDTLLPAFRRMVRDLAREKGIEVTFDVRGGDTEMDKHVLEQVKDPLTHLLRNSINHGIELPAEREARGKPRRGSIILTAERRGGHIAIVIADDGGGLDLEAVRSAALRRGLVLPEAAAELNSEELTSLIFVSGLSTSPIITELAGRGVGLDVVRRNVEALQGRVEVQSTPGAGTTFTLSLPLTLVSTRCLTLEAAGQVYALPVAAIERLILITSDEVSLVEGRQAIRYHGQPVTLISLIDVLRRPNPGNPLAETGQAPAVVLAAAGQRVAFLVDELRSEHELVVKSLGKPLARVPHIAGATILGTGEVILVLNPTDLVRSAQSPSTHRFLAAAAPKVVRAERKKILIVDDSITTRTLEMNILSTAGYEVKLATDGEEALVSLMDNPCDLIVADVSMPRLNGLELTRRIRQDNRYKALPIILVTSLDSPEDKARGVEVGADAYIAKSAFDQDNLLETIRQLI